MGNTRRWRGKERGGKTVMQIKGKYRTRQDRGKGACKFI